MIDFLFYPLQRNIRHAHARKKEIIFSDQKYGYPGRTNLDK